MALTRVLFDPEDGHPGAGHPGAGRPGAGATPLAPGALLTLDPRRSHHLARVLRLAPGAVLEVFDGQGRRFAARLTRADPKACLVQLEQRLERDTESPLPITLAQCLSSADRMDWTIEKAVELGVHAIAPLASARAQTRLTAERAARRIEHWQRIIEAACMQCDRARLPTLAPIRPFAEFVTAPAGGARRFVLSPGAATPLARVGLAAQTPDPVVLLVGPESGFSDAERAQAVSAGFEAVSLGPRVLRTETAGLAAIAVLQALAGDFRTAAPPTE